MKFTDYIRKSLEWFYPDTLRPEDVEAIHETLQQEGKFSVTVDEDGTHPVIMRPRLSLKTASGLRTAYDTCSVVSTIISRLAAAMINGRLVIRDRKSLQENKYG